MQCKYLPIRLCSLWPDRRLSQVFLCFFVHSNLLSLQQEIPRDGVQHAKPCHRDAAQRPWSWVLSVNMHRQPGRWYDANLRIQQDDLCWHPGCYICHLEPSRSRLRVRFVLLSKQDMTILRWQLKLQMQQNWLRKGIKTYKYFQLYNLRNQFDPFSFPP